MFKTTEQVFEMLHGAARDALERIEAECNTMRTRAEAAEAEAASLRAELEQARLDAEALAVAVHGLDDCYWMNRLQAAGLDEADVVALDALYNRLYDRPDAEVVAAIRRTARGGAR